MPHYTIVTTEQLTATIPAACRDYMGYDRDYTLGECCYPTPRPLADGRYLISVQLSHLDHMPNRCVYDDIKPNELTMAEQYLGPENIFTDITNLEFAEAQE